jgi:hypothetical protein
MPSYSYTITVLYLIGAAFGASYAYHYDGVWLAVGGGTAVVFLFLAMGVKCENCGVYVYRRDRKSHGVPDIRFFGDWARCPSCNLERAHTKLPK